MRDYNKMVNEVLDKRKKEKEKINNDVERIIEEIIDSFKAFSTDNVTLELDETEALKSQILLAGKKMLLEYQYADEVYNEIRKILQIDIPEMKNFHENFDVKENERKIRISLKEKMC